jgi:hypothetical protein
MELAPPPTPPTQPNAAALAATAEAALAAAKAKASVAAAKEEAAAKAAAWSAVGDDQRRNKSRGATAGRLDLLKFLPVLRKNSPRWVQPLIGSPEKACRLRGLFPLP